MALVRMRHQAALRARVHMRDAVTGAKGDPTGTADLRRRYSSLVEFRWRKVRALLRGALVTQDMLGVDQSKQSALSIAMTALPTDGKIRAFQNWLDKTLSLTTLETDTAYLDPMIVAAYRRGVKRAVRLTQGQTQPPAADDAIASLQQLVMVEMQGINEAVSQQCVRAVSDGLLSGKSGKQLFADCAAVIDKIGIVRSRAMVELMTVKAHGTATLDQFEAAGIKKVGLLPESVRVIKKKVADMRVQDAPRRIGPGSLISRLIQPSLRTIQRIRAVSSRLEGLGEVDILTAGDFDVCPECQGIADDGPYEIDEARSLIPAHPFCRCSFVPAQDARFAGDMNPYHDPETGEFTFGPGGIAFHGTTKELVGRIKRQGLIVRHGKGVSAREDFYGRKGAVFIAKTKAKALYYAKERAAGKSGLRGTPVVLEVHVPKSQAKTFYRDPLHAGGGAGYRTTKIPAKWIKKIHEFKPTHPRGNYDPFSWDSIADAVPDADAEVAWVVVDYNPYHDPATGEFASGGGGDLGPELGTHAVEFRLQPSVAHEYGKRQTMHVKATSWQEAANKVVEHHKAAGAFHTRIVKVTNLNGRRIYVPKGGD